MAKHYPYSQWCKRDNKAMGRYIDKTEILQYFHIIKERNDYRDFYNRLFEQINKNCEDIKKWIYKNQLDPHQYKKKGEKKDLFGFMDFLVIDPNVGAIAIQATGQHGHIKHRQEILRNIYAQRWINFHPIELWSYRKVKYKRGMKKMIWKPRIENLTMKMFIESALK